MYIMRVYITKVQQKNCRSLHPDPEKEHCKMKFILLLVIASCAYYINALDCGIRRGTDEALHQVMSICVKNNETLAKIMKLTSGSDFSSSSSSSMEAQQSDHQIKTGFGREIRDGQSILQPMLRVRRSKFNTLYNGNERYGKLQEETTTEDSRENSHEKSKEQSNETNEDVSEICIVKCVFQNFGMMDSEESFDHEKFIENLLKTAETRELKDFLQDSANECFQQIDKESDLDSCVYATKLAECLAKKAKSNCEDWPIADFPFKY